MFNTFYRTDTCGELRISDVGKKVILSGWVQKSRKLGGMTFIDLRDRYGITQLVVEADGTCYPCDFYCLDEFECLNINSADIADILACEGLKKFFEHNEEKNSLCPSCSVRSVCGGGCKRYRSLYNQLSGYCPQADFILHALDKLRSINR